MSASINIYKLIILIFIPCAVFAQGSATHQVAGQMINKRQMHGSVILGNYLYVIGGELGGVNTAIWTDSVETARINPDGTLGKAFMNTPMPEKRAYISSSTVSVNDIVYVIGGDEGGTRFNTVLWARPSASGMLETWNKSSPFAETGRGFFPVVTTPGYLHLLGGNDSNQRPLTDVISGKISSSGEIIEWEAGPALPKPLWFHQAATLGGRVWIWGGLSGSSNARTISKGVYSAPILGNGELGLWRRESQVPDKPASSASTATAGSFLISFFGRYENRSVSREVWFNKLDGSQLGEWMSIGTTIPVNLYTTTATDYRRGNVYIPCGRNNPREHPDSVENNVYMLSLAPGLKEDLADSSDYTYEVQDKLSDSAVAGFHSYNDAVERFESSTLPLVLYFNIEGAALCKEQKQALVEGGFSSIYGNGIFSWIDVKDWPQVAEELGIYRAPAWLIYDQNKNEVYRNYGVVSVDELTTVISPGG